MRYSKLTNGFYQEKTEYLNLPEDAISISDELYNEVIEGQNAGGFIVPGENGLPTISKSPSLSKDQVYSVNKNRVDAAIRDTLQSISVLQTKLLMGREVSEEEKKLLNNCLDYIDEVGALDIGSGDLLDIPSPPIG